MRAVPVIGGRFVNPGLGHQRCDGITMVEASRLHRIVLYHAIIHPAFVERMAGVVASACSHVSAADGVGGILR
jgi:hypothetical protein